MSPTARTGPVRPPTLRDVAQIAEVSIKTVSNVVHDYPHVSAATRERVRAAIKQVGYRPQVAAQQLRTGESGLVTLALPSLTYSYFSHLAQVFIEEAQHRGQTVLLHSTTKGAEEEQSVLEGFKRVLGDGVVFNPLQLEEAQIAQLERTSQPTVFIGEHLPDVLPAGCDYVKIDNVAATHDATAHLLDGGRRAVAFIGQITTAHGTQPHSSGSLRLEGYLRALEEHGIGREQAIIQEVSDWHRADGLEGVRALLGRDVPVDALVCANDELAIGALAGLRRAGLRVPEDVAVIGYDDTPDALFTAPPLSSISPDKQVLARTALDLLTERVRGYDGPPRIIENPYTLEARESTAPAAPSLQEIA
ncbi:LacI family DNA-binding transcriptional regulator [Brachybacterium hainanense]|uniref:LacI family DNA-binding transcriptional regulator n=1 Tax=Brachybacterium hainanense TaxID=1541174 RepID=A0ABV6R6E5_9MICO